MTNKSELVRVTVSAIVKQGNKILMIKEKDDIGRMFLSEPVGHLDKGEDIEEAVIREVREETGYKIKIIDLFKVIHTRHAISSLSNSVRFVFIGSITGRAKKKERNISPIWITSAEIKKNWKLITRPASRVALKAYLYKGHKGQMFLSIKGRSN